MLESYDRALRRSLKWEGGYSNHPKDPGGATMKGVTQRVYDGYRAEQKQTRQSVKNISDTEVRAIYRELYADRVRFDELPAGVDAAVLDGAINSGPAQAVKWLQRALGVKVDGNLGPATLAAARIAPAAKTVLAIMDHRRAFLRSLKTWSTFGKGWTARVNDIEKFAFNLANGTANSVARPLETPAAPRGTIEQAKPRPSKQLGSAAAGAGTSGVVIAGALKETKDSLTPLAGNSNWIDSALAVIAIVSVLTVIAGLAWRQWQKRQAKKQAEALDLPEQVAA